MIEGIGCQDIGYWNFVEIGLDEVFFVIGLFVGKIIYDCFGKVMGVDVDIVIFVFFVVNKIGLIIFRD